MNYYKFISLNIILCIYFISGIEATCTAKSSYSEWKAGVTGSLTVNEISPQNECTFYLKCPTSYFVSISNLKLVDNHKDSQLIIGNKNYNIYHDNYFLASNSNNLRIHRTTRSHKFGGITLKYICNKINSSNTSIQKLMTCSSNQVLVPDTVAYNNEFKHAQLDIISEKTTSTIYGTLYRQLNSLSYSGDVFLKFTAPSSIEYALLYSCYEQKCPSSSGSSFHHLLTKSKGKLTISIDKKTSILCNWIIKCPKNKEKIKFELTHIM